MDDTIIFMSAYKATSYAKSKHFFRKKVKHDILFDKYHINYIIIGDKLISSKGGMIIHTDYDYVHQKAEFTYTIANKKHSIQEYEDIIKQNALYVNIFQSQLVLCDQDYFKMDYFISLESCLVYIGNSVFKIDPIVFSINNTMMISFEMIDFETGVAINKNDICGIGKNYNLLNVESYKYIGDDNKIVADCRISKLIYQNISNFFIDIFGDKLNVNNYSFVHNILVISNEIDNLNKYLCDLIQVNKIPSLLKNIGTTGFYKYYPQDGVSVITDYKDNAYITAAFDGLILESLKMYIHLLQIVNLDITNNIKDVINNNLYLESLFFTPNVPIETNNMFNCIYEMKSFKNRKKALDIKIEYLMAKNDSLRNKNAIMLNILLYIISLLGAIDVLELFEERFGLPFEYSVAAVLGAFIILGIVWFVRERKNNNNF